MLASPDAPARTRSSAPPASSRARRSRSLKTPYRAPARRGGQPRARRCVHGCRVDEPAPAAPARVDDEAPRRAPPDGVVVLARGECQHRSDVVRLQIRVVGEDLLVGRTRRHAVEAAPAAAGPSLGGPTVERPSRRQPLQVGQDPDPPHRAARERSAHWRLTPSAALRAVSHGSGGGKGAAVKTPHTRPGGTIVPPDGSDR